MRSSGCLTRSTQNLSRGGCTFEGGEGGMKPTLNADVESIRIVLVQDYLANHVHSTTKFGNDDDQAGGTGKGWYRIVRDPEEASAFIAAGKLAVILGTEVQHLFNCDSIATLTGPPAAPRQSTKASIALKPWESTTFSRFTTSWTSLPAPQRSSHSIAALRRLAPTLVTSALRLGSPVWVNSSTRSWQAAAC